MADQVSFCCDICSEELSLLQNLKRHYKRTHGLNPEEIKEKTAELRENTFQCYDCKKYVQRLDKHKKKCKGPMPSTSQNLEVTQPATDSALPKARQLPRATIFDDLSKAWDADELPFPWQCPFCEQHVHISVDLHRDLCHGSP